MRNVSLQYFVTLPATKAYSIISDFPSYESHTEAVKKIEVTNMEGATCVSDWEVKFRDGLLKWTEKDIFFPELLKIEFYQIEGDLEILKGYWSVEAIDETTSNIKFLADLDLGIPQLEKMLEPIAEEALKENIESIIKGLFGKAFASSTEVEGNSYEYS